LETQNTYKCISILYQLLFIDEIEYLLQGITRVISTLVKSRCFSGYSFCKTTNNFVEVKPSKSLIAS